MSILKVVKEKCKKDGICKKECPWDIIHLDTDDGYPAKIKKLSEMVIGWMRHMLDKEPEKSKDYMADLLSA